MMNRKERRRAAAMNKNVDVFVIGPWNIHSLEEAAENGNEDAKGALGALSHVENYGGKPSCLECHSDSPPLVYVVAHWLGGPVDNDVKVGSFCHECIDYESRMHVVNRHLAKLGVIGEPQLQ